MRIAVYPGSFDPITNGHIDIINRGLNIFDKVIVAIGANSTKKALLSFEERANLIADIFKYDERIVVNPFDSLVIDFVQTKKANAIIRGIRNSTDFEYEYQFAHVNSRLFPGG